MRAMTFNGEFAAGADDATVSRQKPMKNRVQFDLTPKSMDRLTALKAKIEAPSYAEVVKNALRLYEALIEEEEAGRQFFVRDENGNMVPYRIFV